MGKGPPIQPPATGRETGNRSGHGPPTGPGAAGGEGGDQEGAAAVEALVQEADDAGEVQPAQHLALGSELPAVAAREVFEGDGLPGAEVLGLVDEARSALAQEGVDAVAARDPVPDAQLDPCSRDGVGRGQRLEGRVRAGLGNGGPLRLARSQSG